MRIFERLYLWIIGVRATVRERAVARHDFATRIERFRQTHEWELQKLQSEIVIRDKQIEALTELHESLRAKVFQLTRDFESRAKANE